MTAPSNSQSAPLPNETHIGKTALSVADLGEMSEFYRDVVGLRVNRADDDTAVLGVDGTNLLMLEEDSTVAERDPSAAGLFHNAFRVPSRRALGDALARIRNHWQLSGAADHWVSEALYLRDPEGNGVEIYRDFPREEWPRRDDGTVRITTEPLDLDETEAAAAGGSCLPSGTDIGHIHLEVTSLDAFSDFYLDTLGFEEQTALPAASFVSAGGYHHHIGANTWNQRTTSNGGLGLSWFEVVVPDSRTLEVIREQLTSRDIPVNETDDGILVSDPDGIDIRIRAA